MNSTMRGLDASMVSKANRDTGDGLCDNSNQLEGDEKMTPARARLYRTAEFTPEARSHEPDVLPDGPIRVVFMSEQYNEFFKQKECVFACYRTMQDISFIGYYFASALKRFVL